MPRSYVNNASNRSIGRVGMPVGSMPVSRGSGGGGGGASGGASRGSSGSAYGSSSSGTSTNVYVDNAYNRSHGRVGEPLGSHVISTGSSSKQQTGQSDKVYADNAYNRSHGRAGEPLGSKVISKKTGDALSTQDSDVDTYKDNAFNRRVGRVGKVKGTAVYSAKTKTTEEKRYQDNKINREKGRVGKPKGSMPSKNKSQRTKAIKDTNDKINKGEEIDTDERNPSMFDLCDAEYDDAVEQVIFLVNRTEEEEDWKIQTETKETPKTQMTVLQSYVGKTILFGDIQLGKKIGSGGFGEVHFAKWKGTIVAVKMLHNDGVSNRRLRLLNSTNLTILIL